MNETWTTLPSDSDRILAASVDRPSSNAVGEIHATCHAVHASMAVKHSSLSFLLGTHGWNRRFPQVGCAVPFMLVLVTCLIDEQLSVN